MMAAKDLENHDGPILPAELPQAAIALAEAAASANQDTAAETLPPPALELPEGADAQDGTHQAPHNPFPHQEENAQRHVSEEQPIEQVPQVAYGPQLGQVDLNQDGFNTRAKVAGKVTIIGIHDPEGSSLQTMVG